jgi:LPXTG-motif cell wall-anchored protein
VSMSITIPSGYSGQHSIVAAGIGADGAPLFLRSDITVAAPAASGSTAAGTVAFTGPPEDVSLVGLIGLLLLCAGGIVLLRRRRAHR